MLYLLEGLLLKYPFLLHFLDSLPLSLAMVDLLFVVVGACEDLMVELHWVIGRSKPTATCIVVGTIADVCIDVLYG